jgi:hypothetical protein
LVVLTNRKLPWWYMGKVVQATFAISLFLSAAVGAHATLIDWTFHNAVFDDGGRVTGSFVLDTERNVFTPLVTWDVNTSGGDTAAFPAFAYTNLNSQSELIPSLTDLSGLFFMIEGRQLGPIFFPQGALSTPSTVPIVDVPSELGPQTVLEQTLPPLADPGHFRALLSGEMVGTVVPESPAFVPLGVGIGLLLAAAFFRRTGIIALRRSC